MGTEPQTREINELREREQRIRRIVEVKAEQRSEACFREDCVHNFAADLLTLLDLDAIDKLKVAEARLTHLERIADAARRVADALDDGESNLVVVGAAIDLRTELCRTGLRLDR